MRDQLTVKNFIEHLKKAQTDPAVGIPIAKVTGDDLLGLHVAELAPDHCITAHYHHIGSEIYQIVQGKGKIHTGEPLSNNMVRWTTSANVNSGDCFTVHEGEVHQLENMGSLPLIAIIMYPNTHIGHDRFIVPGAIPQ